MSFDVKFTFTGVCGIIPKQNYPASPQGFCVLLPNAWDNNPFPGPFQRTSRIDNTPLRRHCAYLYYRTQHTAGYPINEGSAEIWYFNGHKITLNPTFAGPPTTPDWGTDITGLASFEDISTAGSTDHLLNASTSVLTPNRALVTGHMLFNFGVLSAPAETYRWTFDSYLIRTTTGGFQGPNTRLLNHQVHIEIKGLTRLQITAQPMVAGTALEKSFDFTSGPVEIFIANLCEHNPLRWGSEIAGSGLVDDEDFRWHYELVNNPGSLAGELDPYFCPIPRRTRAIGAGGGFNCFPFKYPAVNF